VGGVHEVFRKIVDRAVKHLKFGYLGDSGAGKTDDVKMKRLDVTKKCGQGVSLPWPAIKLKNDRPAGRVPMW